MRIAPQVRDVDTTAMSLILEEICSRRSKLSRILEAGLQEKKMS